MSKQGGDLWRRLVFDRSLNGMKDDFEVVGEGFCCDGMTSPCCPPVFGRMKVHPGKSHEDTVVRAGIVSRIPSAPVIVNLQYRRWWVRRLQVQGGCPTAGGVQARLVWVFGVAGAQPNVVDEFKFSFRLVGDKSCARSQSLIQVREFLGSHCQGHSSLDAPSELNPPQRIPSPLFVALLVPQAEG